jgi:hypothetical protein
MITGPLMQVMHGHLHLAPPPRGNTAHQPADQAFQESPSEKPNRKPQIMKGPTEFPEIRNNARSKR